MIILLSRAKTALILALILTHDGMAFVNGKGVLQVLPPLQSKLVTRVDHPAVRLHEDGRAQVLVAVPPVRGARCRAAEAEDALVETVELFAVGDGLEVLAVTGLGALLQERFDRLVLFVNVRKVYLY